MQLPEEPQSRDALQVLLIDQRWPETPCCYFMSHVCAAELAGRLGLPELVGNGGKRLAAFLETFCVTIQPNHPERAYDKDLPHHNQPMCVPFNRDL